jgi:hypothetical protein
MRRMSDATLMRLLTVVPVLAATGVVIVVALLAWVISRSSEGGPPFSPIGGFVGAQAGWLVGAAWAIRKEAVRRAGGSAGVEAWRESNAWSATEFGLDHDYDPEGSEFQALLRITEEHGYALRSTAGPARHRSRWQFWRDVE